MTRLTLAPLVALVLALGLGACGGDDGGGGGGGDATRSPAAAADNSFHPVAGGFEPDGTKLADCGNARCLEQAFGNLAYNDGPKKALATFEQRMASDSGVETGCHRIAHIIGSAALARYDGNVARAFSEGSAVCWSGYYHGILERSFTGASSRLELGTIARGLCADEGIRSTSWLAYQCVHGLGHGLMIQSGYDLPLALSVCDDLATDWDRTSCHGGAFMENIASSYGTRSRWLKDDDLVYPCNVVQDRHKLYCYLMVTSRILEANGRDWEDAARICATVEPAWRSTCFQSLGRDASGSTRQQPREIVEICAIAGAGESDCIYGAARDVTSNYASGKPAAELCRIAPEATRARCFTGIGTIVAAFSTSAEERTRACAELTDRYVSACVRGAGATS